MKKTFIYTLLPVLFSVLVAASFTSCSGDEDNTVPYINIGKTPATLEQNYFSIVGASFIDKAMPSSNIENSLVSIYPGSINSQAGQAVTIEIASDIELDNFYIGVDDIDNSNEARGYYKIKAAKIGSMAGLNIYSTTLHFAQNAKSEFLVKICGVATGDDEEEIITKASRIITYLEPDITENEIVGKYYFGIDGATFTDGNMPIANTTRTLTSVFPENIETQAGQSVTVEIVADVELKNLYVGIKDSNLGGKSHGYYEVAATETGSFAGLKKYSVTLDFSQSAKTEFTVKIGGASVNSYGVREVTKPTEIEVNLEPLITENVIEGKWGNIEYKDQGTPETGYIYYEYKKNGAGLLFEDGATTKFTYAYSLSYDRLQITTDKNEIISCKVLFPDINTMNVVERYRYNPTTGETTKTGIEYSLTRIEE